MGLCRILDMDFREFPFHALGCIRPRRSAGEDRRTSARSRGDTGGHTEVLVAV
jgi:hypothetical protein